ncbi:MAG: RDD family protein [Synergistaceae bacterium]|nr:RDD family protein [Synergistaceae bacterium]
MKEWYCAINGKASGPFPKEELKKLADQGVLTGDTLVWNEDSDNSGRDWRRAAETEVADILQSGGATTRTPLIPHTSSEIRFIGSPQAAGRAFGGQSPESADFILASRWRRLLAVLCDFLVIFLFAFVSIFLAGVVVLYASRITSSDLGGYLIISLPVLVLNLTLFGVNLRLLYKDGQTIGKKILCVRIANRDGIRAKLVKIIFLRVVPFWVISIIANGAQKLLELGWDQYYTRLQLISTICGLLLLADTLFIFRKDRRTLHDMLAGTIVIMSAK